MVAWVVNFRRPSLQTLPSGLRSVASAVDRFAVTKNEGGAPPLFPDLLYFHYPLSFHALAAPFAFLVIAKDLTYLFSISCSLFCKNTRGGGPSLLEFNGWSPLSRPGSRNRRFASSGTQKNSGVDRYAVTRINVRFAVTRSEDQCLRRGSA